GGAAMDARGRGPGAGGSGRRRGRGSTSITALRLAEEAIVPNETVARDYSVAGPENRRARERGLAGATWYRCPLPRRRLRELSRRRNGPALRDTFIAILLLAVTGALAY